jgi:hypothetical protein
MNISFYKNYNMSKFSFKKGFGQIQQKDANKVRDEIMESLNLKSRGSWHLRLNGDIEPKISEVKLIEGIFHKYGVTEIWDDDE